MIHGLPDDIPCTGCEGADSLTMPHRKNGAYVIKHTDGNIMPILDQLVSCRPHALHSIDPQAKVDLGEVKRLVGDKVCLAGNVNCGDEHRIGLGDDAVSQPPPALSS